MNIKCPNCGKFSICETFKDREDVMLLGERVCSKMIEPEYAIMCSNCNSKWKGFSVTYGKDGEFKSFSFID